MPQNVLTLTPVDPTVSGWSAALEAAVVGVRNAMRYFVPFVAIQGDTTRPTYVAIQLRDCQGNNILETCFVRLRVADSFANSINATIAVNAGTLVETVTADKDLVVQSTANGIVVLAVTCAVAQDMYILIGMPPVRPQRAFYGNSLKVTHVAPAYSGLLNSLNQPIYNVGGSPLYHG